MIASSSHKIRNHRFSVGNIKFDFEMMEEIILKQPNISLDSLLLKLRLINLGELTKPWDWGKREVVDEDVYIEALDIIMEQIGKLRDDLRKESLVKKLSGIK